MDQKPIVFCDKLVVNQTHKKAHKSFGPLIIRVDDETGQESRTIKPKTVEGKYKSSVQICSDGHTVKFDGNPSRFNRKNNIQGIDLDLAKAKVNEIITNLGLPAFTSEYVIGPEGREYTGARITRLDMTTNLKMGSPTKRDRYQKWIQTQEYPNLVKLCFNKNTYFGKQSESRTLRIYDKAKEIIDKKGDLNIAERLNRQGVLRYEFEYRKFLKSKGLNMWHRATQKELENQFLGDIENMTRTITEIDMEELPSKVLGTYLMYLNHINPKNHMSKNTFYAHRKVLLKYGVDIGNMTVFRIRQDPVVIEPEPYNDDQRELKFGE